MQGDYTIIYGRAKPKLRIGKSLPTTRENTPYRPGVFSYMVKCTSMRQSLQWFYDRIGQTVSRNGRDFTIVNERYADYAWSLQDKGFEYV